MLLPRIPPPMIIFSWNDWTFVIWSEILIIELLNNGFSDSIFLTVEDYFNADFLTALFYFSRFAINMVNLSLIYLGCSFLRLDSILWNNLLFTFTNEPSDIWRLPLWVRSFLLDFLIDFMNSSSSCFSISLISRSSRPF
jgi:hypothetical protein